MSSTKVSKKKAAVPGAVPKAKPANKKASQRFPPVGPAAIGDAARDAVYAELTESIEKVDALADAIPGDPSDPDVRAAFFAAAAKLLAERQAVVRSGCCRE